FPWKFYTDFSFVDTPKLPYGQSSKKSIPHLLPHTRRCQSKTPSFRQEFETQLNLSYIIIVTHVPRFRKSFHPLHNSLAGSLQNSHLSMAEINTYILSGTSRASFRLESDLIHPLHIPYFVSPKIYQLFGCHICFIRRFHDHFHIDKVFTPNICFNSLSNFIKI